MQNYNYKQGASLARRPFTNLEVHFSGSRHLRTSSSIVLFWPRYGKLQTTTIVYFITADLQVVLITLCEILSWGGGGGGGGGGGTL